MNILNQIFGGRTNKENLFESAPYLSPWYFSSVSPKLVRNGLSLRWKRVEKIKEEYVGVTFLQGPDGECYGILKTYVYLLPGPNCDTFLIWRRSEETTLSLSLYGTADLKIVLDAEIIALELTADSKRLYHFNSSPKAIQSMPIKPTQEEQTIFFENHFKAFSDFCVVTEIPALYENGNAKWHNTAIILVSPRTDRGFVYPQDWFNKADADFGYEWITRAVQDTNTRLIHGQGIRIADFVLDKTNRQRKR